MKWKLVYLWMASLYSTLESSTINLEANTHDGRFHLHYDE
jgi:hypothetical protein